MFKLEVGQSQNANAASEQQADGKNLVTRRPEPQAKSKKSPDPQNGEPQFGEINQGSADDIGPLVAEYGIGVQNIRIVKNTNTNTST